MSKFIQTCNMLTSRVYYQGPSVPNKNSSYFFHFQSTWIRLLTVKIRWSSE